jgi:hypothetical protein
VALNAIVPQDKTCSFTVTVIPGSPPVLSIVQSGTNVILSWSNIFSCYQLQYAAQLFPTNLWTNYAGAVTASGGNFYATNATIATNRVFRLKY